MAWGNMKKKEGRETKMKKTYKIEVDCANCALKMEEAAKYLQGTEAKQESKEELDNIWQEDSGEMSISIEEIEVGRD